MLDLAERRSDASNYMAGGLGLWDTDNETIESLIELKKQMNEHEQFQKRAVSAIYLQGVLLHNLGLDRDTTHVNEDSMAAVDKLKADAKVPCCHVVTSDEGTSYCGLAENAVLRLREELGEATERGERYRKAGLAMDCTVAALRAELEGLRAREEVAP